MSEIRPEDFVLHKPSGEEWVVAGVSGNKIIPCGYPFPSMANLADCELLESRNLPQPDEVKKALRRHGLESFVENDESQFCRRHYEPRAI